MLKKLIACLLLTLGLACDGDNGNSEKSCVELGDNPGFLLGFESCPTDGLFQVCNHFACNLFEDITGLPMPPDLQVTIRPLDCELIDCFNLECDLREEFEIIGIGLFAIEAMFFGKVIVDEEDAFDYECAPII